MPIDRTRATEYLRDFAFRRLFVDELGWDNPTSRHAEIVPAEGATFTLEPVAEKRGVRIFHCAVIPDRPVRQRIEREVTKLAYEHLIIFSDAAKARQVWQWVAREKGKPAAFREHLWLTAQSPEPLLQKLDHIAFSLDEEEGLTLAGATVRMRDAFDRERITKRFYEAFKQQHDQFLGFITGLTSAADKAWYASLMLNRLMFVYFIQKKRFLDGDIDYLRNRLAIVRAEQGQDQFHSFYRAFLLKLFHGGLATPKDARDAETARLIGDIPYLNGGLFEPHALEGEGNTIQIGDAAFESIFAFFDQYEWTLDTRAIERADGREINPDVLGHIFEKYINQKQMGAYYTKEDITDYITRSTVIPWLFRNAENHDKVAFEPGGAVWRMLSDSPDTYIFRSVKHGADQPLPDNIAAGIGDVAARGDWNRTASAELGLPTETWREVVARRERYESVKATAAAGEISSIEEFITHNLDIRQFALDAIQYAESPDLVRAFWKGISAVKVLDPACGSGAFLFAALNILYDLYDACLERMEQFVQTAPEGSGPRQLYSDFREVLARIACHPSRPYFIYKSIILDNLYGVDIMDEAVEICKLRLFLKLAAQLESADQIEPLPDIDFNIRAGNTLIGYTSFDDVRGAQERRGFVMDDHAATIEASAQDLDAAFRLFRQQQTELHGQIDGRHKADLRARLAELEGRLDRFLARDYGIEGDDNLAENAEFKAWKASHKPFHWLVEFYGIIQAGGFDVLVGNPPYIEKSQIEYEPLALPNTSGCSNLYADFIEKGWLLLSQSGDLGLIVPISLVSIDGYASVRNLVLSQSSFVAMSHWSVFPAKLFTGVAQRLTILIASRGEQKLAPLTTGYRKWFEGERPFLFETLAYVPASEAFSGFPKSGDVILMDALSSIARPDRGRRSLGLTLSSGRHELLYHRSPNNFIRAHTSPPYYRGARGETVSKDHMRFLTFNSARDRDVAAGSIMSTVFFILYETYGNCRNLTDADIARMPVPADSEFQHAIASLSSELMRHMDKNAVRKKREQKKTGTVIYDEYYVRQSKAQIDAIDRQLAESFDLSDEALDKIINYDIKYRMGADEDDAD